MQLDDDRRPSRRRPPRDPSGVRGGRGELAVPVGPTLAVEPLSIYENNGDGHTLRRHCDPRPGADARRLAAHPGLPATGSFLSVEVAQRCTEACIAAAGEQVLAWLAGAEQRLAIGPLDTGAVIGSVLRRDRWLEGKTTPDPVTAVLTVLRRHSGYASGFAVRTSFPVPADTVRRAVPVDIEESAP